MKKSIVFLFALILALLPLGTAGYAYADTTEEIKLTSKAALLMDYSTDTVIFEKNPDERLPIASMTKLASLSLVLDAVNKGIIKENDMVTVSEKAAKVGGSSAFLDAGSSYKVTDLIKTIVIASANDSCVALAEHLAGSEDVFVSRMNKLASSLGLNNTNFVNSTGLPVENHYSSARDITKIYKQVCNNPIYRRYSKIWMDDFIHPSGRKTGLVNTNRLIKTYDGIEGGKTGYTDASKFCLTASASRGQTRLIGVIIGAGDSKTRFAEMTSLFNYGFSNYESKFVVNHEIPVTISKFDKANKQMEIFPSRDSLLFVRKGEDNTFTTDYHIDKISAPIRAGEKVGKMFVFDKDNMVVDEIDLIVTQDLKRENLSEIIGKIVSVW